MTYILRSSTNSLFHDFVERIRSHPYPNEEHDTLIKLTIESKRGHIDIFGTCLENGTLSFSYRKGNAFHPISAQFLQGMLYLVETLLIDPDDLSTIETS